MIGDRMKKIQYSRNNLHCMTCNRIVLYVIIIMLIVLNYVILGKRLIVNEYKVEYYCWACAFEGLIYLKLE